MVQSKDRASLILPIILTTFLWIGAFPVLALQNPTARQDLEPALTKMLCDGRWDPQTLWQNEIFDGQIETLTIEDAFGRPLEMRELLNRAQSIASTRHRGGYTAGICQSGKRGFIAVMPAPQSPHQTDRSLLLPRQQLKSMCKEWSLDYHRFSGGISHPLKDTELLIQLAKLEPGVISVTCRPKFPRWLGAKTWYFIPVHPNFLLTQTVPEWKNPIPSPPDNRDLREKLLGWIEKIRVREQLPPFQINESIQKAAEALTVNHTIDHDLSLLKQTKNKYEFDSLTLKGENRVQGQNIDEIIWLLWNSPKHRDLLLERAPSGYQSVIGVAHASSQTDHLVTIVVGHQKILQIVQKPDRQPLKMQ